MSRRRVVRGGWVASIGAALLLFAPSSAPAAELKDSSAVVALDGLWLFRPGDNPNFARRGLDDMRWVERRLPGGRIAWRDRWAGFGWYRVHVDVAEGVVGHDVMVSVGLVREVAEVYVNGALVAARGRFGTNLESGSRITPLAGLVPAGLLRAGDNVIALRVYDPSYHGGLIAGPLLLGHPDEVRRRVERQTLWTAGMRLALAGLAILVGLAHLLLPRQQGSAARWMVGAGVALATVHVAGLGGLEALVPADLAARLPLLSMLAALLCFGSFFASHYGDFGSRNRLIGQVVIVVTICAMLFLPPVGVFVMGGPMLFAIALLTTFYAAQLCMQAVRRDEPVALPIFVGLSLLAVATVYDGFVVQESDLLPPLTAMGAVAVATLNAVLQARQLSFEHRDALENVGRLSRRLEGQPFRNLLDASALPIHDAEAFLASAIHEVARDLQVRRCSLVLNHNDGKLRIRASVGLPRHLMRRVMEPDSISAYVFRQRTMLTPQNLPPGLSTVGRDQHATETFIAYPVVREGATLGVLNISDRSDGGAFGAEDEQRIAEIAERLALCLSLFDRSALAPPPEIDDRRHRRMIRRRASAKAKRLETTRPGTVRVSSAEILNDIAAEGELVAEAATPWAHLEEAATAAAAGLDPFRPRRDSGPAPSDVPASGSAASPPATVPVPAEAMRPSTAAAPAEPLPEEAPRVPPDATPPPVEPS